MLLVPVLALKIPVQSARVDLDGWFPAVDFLQPFVKS